MGHCLFKAGLKLLRMLAADTQETILEALASGRTAERFQVLKEASQAAEHLVGLERGCKQAQAKRARTEIRLDKVEEARP